MLEVLLQFVLAISVPLLHYEPAALFVFDPRQPHTFPVRQDRGATIFPERIN